LRNFISDRRGVTALEYSLLAATIALALASVLDVLVHQALAGLGHVLHIIIDGPTSH